MERDLVLEEKIEIEEESSSLSKILVSPRNYSWINSEVLVAIVKVDQAELSSAEVCGKTLFEWVSLATNGTKQIVLESISDAEILNILKQNCEGKNYVFLTYSNLAYLQKKTFCDMMYFFASSGFEAMALPKGFVFKTEHLLKMQTLSADVKKSFGSKDFEEVNTAQKLSDFHNFQSEKIRKFHKDNGVILLGANSIFIDADVEIESGSIIFPNNMICGKTYIGKHVTLKSGNVIKDSMICDNSIVELSSITNSKISENKEIGPFKRLKDESV